MTNDEPEDDEVTGLPAPLETWPRLYAAVAAHLVVWIIFFIWLGGRFQ